MRAIDFHVHLPTPDWLDESCLAELQGLGLPDEVLAQVLHENAARILHLD